ncbi:L,D-transpeptidase family protein [Methylomarinum vadi]|uniref:L,D-transpeptidase family protein n=1 Tax=Methylomarinum vadi TaxID=438855 RepID=UPI00068A99B4|nr:L,D-transpeptidase family protein [Methylomarinum vadi]
MNYFKVPTFLVQCIILLHCVIFSLVSAFADSSVSSSFPPPAVITSVLSFRKHPYLSQTISESEQVALKRLYFESPQPLLWLSRDDLHTHAAEVFRLLESAPDSGLPIAVYDVDNLKTKWRQLQGKQPANNFELTLLDTALSLSTLRYLSDVHRGRIDRKNERFGFWRATDYDLLLGFLIDAVRNVQITQLTERVEPNWSSYRRLKQALRHYRELARNFRFPSLVFEGMLEEGDSDPQIPLLRHKLQVLGLLHDYADLSDIYRGEMVDALKHFQRLHGLNDDGIVGEKTLAALNTPLTERVRQIELALERMRWLPELHQGQGLILVNIPAFRLWAYQAGNLNGPSDLSMKVVVGIAKKNQTPVFMADLAYLEFRPYWNVPKNITYKEILPSLLKNPDYLEQQNMELVQYFSVNAEPQRLTEDSLQLLRQGAMKIRQRPGPKNSLGLVKFIFPNRYDVYMHDTPAKKLFLSERRDYSHGCIRVEQPRALAQFVLSSRGGWRREEIQEAMREGDNRRVFVRNAIAVLIFYSTAMAIDNEIYFFDDVYNYDERLNQALYPAKGEAASLTASTQ